MLSPPRFQSDLMRHVSASRHATALIYTQLIGIAAISALEISTVSAGHITTHSTRGGVRISSGTLYLQLSLQCLEYVVCVLQVRRHVCRVAIGSTSTTSSRASTTDFK
jgi:hypothetical protein